MQQSTIVARNSGVTNEFATRSLPTTSGFTSSGSSSKDRFDQSSACSLKTAPPFAPDALQTLLEPD